MRAVIRVVVLLGLIVAGLVSPAWSLAVPIDDFTTVDAWMSNPDGGLVEISAERLPDGRPAMRLRFDHEDHQWGNAARAVTLPAHTTGIEIEVVVHEALPQAYLSIWLFEADGDAYLAFFTHDGKRLCDVGKGRRSGFVPISAFRFEPRGNGNKEPTTINKMLVGLGAGRAEVSVARLAFRTIERSVRMPESRTQSLKIERGPKGSAAILNDRFQPRPGDSNPETTAAALREHGWGVTFLKSGDAADESILTRSNFDLLILPYGSRYPYAAYDSIRSYLKTGGCFLSTGGYAFDEPCAPDETGTLVPIDSTLTAEDLGAPEQGLKRLNTRFGKPGDTLGLAADQIGVFDPAYPLENVVVIQSAPEQNVLPPDVRAFFPAEGYSACSMLGSNNPVFPEKWGRHIPLIDCVDPHGRHRGSAGAIAHNYAGPYAGSSWAFFGVTNTDLFAEHGPLLRYLSTVADAVTARVFLHSLSTEFQCYRDGEHVSISCRAANLGSRAFSGSVVFTVIGRDGRPVYASDAAAVSLAAGQTSVLSAGFVLRQRASDLYRVSAELRSEDRLVDATETGFAAYKTESDRRGLDLSYSDNYFRSGDRPTLLSGTNVTGAMLYSANENPLVWDRDLALMSDSGVNVLRLLHFSPLLSDKPAYGSTRPIDLAVDSLPPKLERQLDALVQLCRRHGIVLLLSIHDWMPVELTDEELAAQRRFAELIAARYRGTRDVMIDIQNEPRVELPKESGADAPEHIRRLWNEFLRSKYGSDDALKFAWSHSPPEAALGLVPYRAGSDAWGDVRTLDADEFRNVLVNRWVSANREGAKTGDSDTLVTVGYLQEYSALNKLMCVGDLDFANMHSYSTVERLLTDLKLFDRRFEGRSVSLGEFGARNNHDQRVNSLDVTDQDIDRYLLAGHYTFGLGGSLIANWCWKDMDDVVFPWGIVHSCGGPSKDILKAYRNQSLLFRQVRPVYRSPAVFLAVPISMMLGGRSGAAVGMLYRHVEALCAANADFGVIDDRSLHLLPDSARLVIYPIPFAIPEAAYDRLRRFVEDGGTLCVSGDVSYDALRRRTRTDRLEELCGVRFVSENYPDTNWPDESTRCIEVEPTTAVQREPDVFVRRAGLGTVWYSPAPLFSADGFSRFLFSEALEDLGASGTAQVERIDAGGNLPVHAFRIPEVDGALTLILINPTDSGCVVRILEPGRNKVEIGLGPGETGLARWNAVGELTEAEFSGSLVVGGCAVKGRGRFALVSCDGLEIGRSSRLLVIPFGDGEIDLRPITGGAPLTLQTGEAVRGAWRVLSESTSTVVRASGAGAYDIAIAAPRERLAELGAFVASELTLR